MSEWVKELPVGVTVVGEDGKIIAMNDKARKTFAKYGDNLVGQNVLDCHSGPARQKLGELLAGEKTNCYTIEKNGVKKLIYQTPWYKDGNFAGLVELSLEIPFEMPHFVRK